jgi:hypothetical protein
MQTPWSRPSSYVAFVIAVAGYACGTQAIRTANEPHPEASTGVPVDPVSSVPKPADRAAAGEGVVTLRAPVSTEAVMALVRRVFEAFHARETSGIELDLDDNIVDVRAEGEITKARWQFISELRLRMKGTNAFEQLDVDLMYRAQDVEIFARDELSLPGRPSRPASMGADDLLVRIPVATPRLGADILFGDEIRLLLRRDGSRYRIRGYGEVVPK